MGETLRNGRDKPIGVTFLASPDDGRDQQSRGGPAQRLTSERLENAPLEAVKKTTALVDAAIARDQRRDQRDRRRPIVVPR